MQTLLYTGIPLTEFHTLVSCLQPFAPTKSSMPVVDPILMLYENKTHFAKPGQQNAQTDTLHRTQHFLHAGDEVMGDHGFTVRDLPEECRVSLIMPAFTRKGSQLTNEEVTHTCRVASACIHVERAIRCLKMYKIPSQTVPINLVSKIGKILKLCAGQVDVRAFFKSKVRTSVLQIHEKNTWLQSLRTCNYFI